MKLLVLLLLVGLTAVVSRSSENESPEYIAEGFIIIKDEKIYTSEHDIVKIIVPPGRFYDTPPEKRQDFPILFFVQGDFKEDGTFDSKGLFVLKIKTGEATKLLDNGVDITLAVNDTEKKVYFAATDGIYIYNAENNTAEQFGSVNDNIISIAKAKSENGIYALTANKTLYKVTESGEKKVRVDEVKNARKIILDDKDNIYFYNDKKKVYVFTKNGLIEVKYSPENPNKITLWEPLRYSQTGIPLLIDETLYTIHDEKGSIEPQTNILTQHNVAFYYTKDEGQYFSYKKNIYKTFRL